MNDGGKYKIYYGSCEEWTGCSVKDYIFSIKYAESDDGVKQFGKSPGFAGEAVEV